MQEWLLSRPGFSAAAMVVDFLGWRVVLILSVGGGLVCLIASEEIICMRNSRSRDTHVK